MITRLTCAPVRTVKLGRERAGRRKLLAVLWRVPSDPMFRCVTEVPVCSAPL